VAEGGARGTAGTARHSMSSSHKWPIHNFAYKNAKERGAPHYVLSFPFIFSLPITNLCGAGCILITIRQQHVRIVAARHGAGERGGAARSRPGGDPEETRRRLGGDPEETRRRPGGDPEETRRRLGGDPEKTRRRPGGDPEARTGGRRGGGRRGVGGGGHQSGPTFSTF
jgi:hypothetical protein